MQRHHSPCMRCSSACISSHDLVAQHATCVCYPPTTWLNYYSVLSAGKAPAAATQLLQQLQLFPIVFSPPKDLQPVLGLSFGTRCVAVMAAAERLLHTLPLEVRFKPHIVAAHMKTSYIIVYCCHAVSMPWCCVDSRSSCHLGCTEPAASATRHNVDVSIDQSTNEYHHADGWCWPADQVFLMEGAKEKEGAEWNQRICYVYLILRMLHHAELSCSSARYLRHAS